MNYLSDLSLKCILLLTFSACFFSCSSKNNPTYEINVTSIPTEGGSVVFLPEGEIHDKGTELLITAVPSQGYLFSKWEGDYSSDINPIKLTVTEDMFINSVFEKKTYPLSVIVEGKGTVTEQVLKLKDYEYGTKVNLTAIPDSDWKFVGWRGALSSDENPTEITIDFEKEVTAKFDLKSLIIGGEDNDTGFSIIGTSDGGYAITGTSRSQEAEFTKEGRSGLYAFIAKIDSNWNVQWIKAFGGSGYDWSNSIAEGSNNGIVIYGQTTSSDGEFSGEQSSISDLFVLKVNNEGVIEWVRTFGGSNFSEGYSIISTTDGGFVATGQAASNDGDFEGLNKGWADVFVIKLNETGEKQWVKNFGGSGLDLGSSIVSTLDGGFLTTGLTISNDGDFENLNQGKGDAFVIRLNEAGEIQWSKTFGGSGYDKAQSIVATSDGGSVLTGITFSDDGDFEAPNKGQGDVFIIKLNGTGEKQWVRTFGGSGDDTGYGVVQSPDGSIVLTGEARSNDGDFAELSKGGSDVFVIKLDEMGGTQWVKTFGGTDYDRGHALVSKSDGGVVLTGTVDSDISIINLDSNGN